MKALQVRIRKVKKSDIDRIIDIERYWHHLSHWSIDSYYRLLNDDGFTRWTVRAERRIVQQIHYAQVTQMIHGISARRAQWLLAIGFPLESAPEIHLSPSWWPWVPIVPFRISVVTE